MSTSLVRTVPAPAALPPGLKSRLRLKHLELFRQVCALQSLRKAAQAANMTQPAATKLVQELEEMFGLPLFHRDRRGLRPTAQGEALRRHVDVVMADVGNMYADAHLFAAGGTGLIRLGIIPSLSSALLARSVNALVAAHPRASIQMRESSTDELLEALAANQLDAMFGRVLHAGSAGALRITKVYTEAFEIVCASTHPLARRRSVTWQQLCVQPWVLPASGPLREMSEDLFTAQGVLRPRVAVGSGSFHQTRHVIASGAMLGILPRSIALQGRADGDLVVLRTGQGLTFPPISLIARKDIERSPLLIEFEQIVLRTTAALNLK